MSTEINKRSGRTRVRKEVSKLPAKKKRNLAAHFGKWKNKLDGLAYQKKVRSGWN